MLGVWCLPGMSSVGRHRCDCVSFAKLCQHARRPKALRWLLGLYAGVNALACHHTHALLFAILLLVALEALFGRLHADYGRSLPSPHHHLL